MASRRFGAILKGEPVPGLRGEGQERLPGPFLGLDVVNVGVVVLHRSGDVAAKEDRSSKQGRNACICSFVQFVQAYFLPLLML